MVPPGEALDAESEMNLVGRHQAIGSRLHLNFASQPTTLETFFGLTRPVLDLPMSLHRGYCRTGSASPSTSRVPHRFWTGQEAGPTVALLLPCWPTWPLTA